VNHIYTVPHTESSRMCEPSASQSVIATGTNSNWVNC
jgi:hypothetical protein